MSTSAPLTLTNLNAAISTGREDLLRPYIDKAIGIYCHLRHITVGPRPARMSERSGAYGDAYYISFNAVYEVWKRICVTFNPSRDFEKYFDKAIRNKIVTLLKNGGRTDLLSRPAKERSKDDIFDNFAKVDADGYWGDSGSEPDNTESDREGKISVFMSDALDALIEFVNTLPEKERTVFFASKFGKEFSDQPVKQKNYAKELAKQYGISSGYIRKLASELKDKALAELRDRGFTKRAFTSFECLQTTPSYVRVYDEVIEATEQLTPFEQFFLLTHIESLR